MDAGTEDWHFISGTARSLYMIEYIVGPKIRYVSNLMAIHTDPDFIPPQVSPKLAKAISESPFLLGVAFTHPDILNAFAARYFLKNPNRDNSGSAIEKAFLKNSGTDVPKTLGVRQALQDALIAARREVAADASIDPEYQLAPLPKGFEDHTPVLTPKDADLGLIVDCPGHGRGTIVAVHADNITVLFPQNGAEPISMLLNYKDGQIFVARNAGSTEDLPLVPIQDVATRRKMQDEIEHERTAEGFGNFDEGNGKTGTVSIASGGGKQAVGTNSTMSAKAVTLSQHDRADLLKLMDMLNLDPHDTMRDPRFVHHAELASLFNLRAKLGKGDKMPTVVDLYVDRITCDSCLKNLSLVAAYLGIEELRVYTRENGGTEPPLIIQGRR
jgi:hypothetical protein